MMRLHSFGGRCLDVYFVTDLSIILATVSPVVILAVYNLTPHSMSMSTWAAQLSPRFPSAHFSGAGSNSPPSLLPSPSHTGGMTRPSHASPPPREESPLDIKPHVKRQLEQLSDASYEPIERLVDVKGYPLLGTCVFFRSWNQRHSPCRTDDLSML